MKTRTALVSTLVAGLGLLACNKAADTLGPSESPTGTATLAARLSSDSSEVAYILRQTDTVRATLDTGTTTASMINLSKIEVDYDSGKVRFPSFRVEVYYKLTLEGIVHGQTLWSANHGGKLEANGSAANKPVLKVSLSNLNLKPPTIAVTGTTATLASNSIGLVAKLYWTRNAGTGWTAYDDSPISLKVNLADTILAKDSIDGKAGSTVTTRIVPVSGTVEVNTTTALKNLAVTEPATSISFDSATRAYSITVPAGTTGLNLTADTAAVDQTIKIEGAEVPSGQPKLVAIPTDSTIEVVVTNSKNTSAPPRTYTIAVRFEAPISTSEADTSSQLKSLSVAGRTLKSAFTKATTSYTLTLPASVTSLSLSAEAISANASIKLQSTTMGQTFAASPVSVSGNVSQITLVVTNSKTSNPTTYTIALLRIHAPTVPDSVGPYGIARLKYATGPLGTLTIPVTPKTTSSTCSYRRDDTPDSWTALGSTTPSIDLAKSGHYWFRCELNGVYSDSLMYAYSLVQSPHVVARDTTFPDELKTTIALDSLNDSRSSSSPTNAKQSIQYCLGDSTACSAQASWTPYSTGTALTFAATTILNARTVETGGSVPVYSRAVKRVFTKSAPLLNSLASTGTLKFGTAVKDSSEALNAYWAAISGDTGSHSERTLASGLPADSSLKFTTTWGIPIQQYGMWSLLALPIGKNGESYDFSGVHKIRLKIRKSDANTAVWVGPGSPLYDSVVLNPKGGFLADSLPAVTSDFEVMTLTLPEMGMSDWGSTTWTWDDLKANVRSINIWVGATYSGEGYTVNNTQPSWVEVKDIELLDMNDVVVVPAKR